MNSKKVIIYLGLGFLAWGIIFSIWLGIPNFALLLVGICLILVGLENENENEKISKKSLKTINEAKRDCPNCALARKVGLKYCQECGKKL